MKLQNRAIDGFMSRPDPRIRAVLVYGPDAGLVRDRADTLARTVVEDLGDPFRVAELSIRATATNPAHLFDEVTAQALTGGRRLIRFRDSDDSLAAPFTALFSAEPPGDSLVVVEGGDLGPRSRLRLAFEAATIGAALPCYIEDQQGLRRIMSELAAAQGMVLDPDAQEFLAANLIGDRLVAKGEIEKLALYKGASATGAAGRQEVRVGLEDVQAAIGDGASQLSLDDPAWAAGSGDFAALDRALARLFAESTAAVTILRAVQRHFQRLHWVHAEIAAGATADAALTALKPPVYFKQRSILATQVRQWPPGALRQALERLTEAEAECKRTNMPDETLTGRVLFQLAAMARARRQQ